MSAPRRHSRDGAHTGRPRKLARRHTPLMEGFVLKQYWGVELEDKGTVVRVPVITHQTLNAVKLTPQAKWLREICFGAKYPNSDSLAAIRMTLTDIRHKAVHNAAQVLDAENVTGTYAGEAGGDGGMAALGMSDHESDTADFDADDVDDDVDPDAEDSEFRRVGVHMRPWISIAIHDTLCQIVLLKKPQLLIHTTNESLLAFALAVHADRKRVKNGQTLIKPHKSFQTQLTFDRVFTGVHERARFKYIEDQRLFEIHYTDDTGAKRKERTKQLPHRYFTGEAFTYDTWFNVVVGFVTQCRNRWNQLDASSQPRYGISSD